MTDERTLRCDGCGDEVPSTLVQWRVDKEGRAVVWNHRAASGGACRTYTATRTSEGTPQAASATFANALNRKDQPWTMRQIDTGETIAYHLREPNDVLWVAANVVAAAGYEPSVVLPVVDVHAVTMLASVPVGITHHTRGHEYLYLRLAVGDWLLCAKGERPLMRRLSDEDFRALLADRGLDLGDRDALGADVEVV